MASAPGKWEVVKKNKKPGGGSGADLFHRFSTSGQSQQGSLISPNPGLLQGKAFQSTPIKPSETIFELGFEKPAKKQNKEQVPPAPVPEQQPLQKKQNAGKQAKKLPAGDTVLKQGKFRSLEDALKALDLSEFQKELEKSQNMFPENPTVWVKDLAGYLNFKLQAPRSDPTLSQYTHDYPYSLVSKELKVIIKALLEKSADVLEHCFDHCIYIMLQELDKSSGESLHGYRICIQAMLLERPKIATMNMSNYLELLRSQQNRPVNCLTVMWALGQAGFTDLTEGLKVWLGIMLPVLGIKSLSPYAIAYLDRLLMMHSNLTKGFGMIGPKDFFPLLDFAFMPNNSLSSSLQDQLRQLYPRLKVLAFGAKPETTLHTYFPSFLSRATPNCPPDMKKELLNCLNQCLNMDPLSFSVWRQLYTKHLSQSSLLLNHLLDTWDSTSKKMRKSLRETINSFKVTNEEFSLKGQNNAQDIESCDMACKTMLNKMKSRGFPWSRLLLVVMVFTAGFIIQDIRTHGSFQASSSARILRHSGLLAISQQAWNKVLHYATEGYGWLEINVPIYYSQMVRVLGPSLEFAWSKTQEATAYLSHLCSSQIAWVRDNLPWFIEWLQSSIPDSVVRFIEYLKELLLYLYQTYLLTTLESVNNALETTWKEIVNSCNGEVSWDCMKRHLASITHASWIYLQNTTLAVKNWALAMISRH
ncbi:transmembrane protein 214 isoform X2 [Rhinatrema bivittatum]|uniref:transmembrane protein 214 isoform X2 n=1 Tax=Rhinatrema bivittatum TaxID=194408 RepID=UPI0011274BC4|nr:transmembrane protein 214 isoform X2 [Rhinatrema bivittatum]